MSVDRVKLRAEAKAGDAAAERALKVTGRTSFMLSGAQLDITVTGLLVGCVAEPMVGQALSDLLGGAGIPPAVTIGVSTVGVLPGWCAGRWPARPGRRRPARCRARSRTRGSRPRRGSRTAGAWCGTSRSGPGRGTWLDASGPAEVFHLAQWPGGPYRVECLSAVGGPVRSSSGVTVDSTAAAQTTLPLDTVPVAGGPALATDPLEPDLLQTVRLLSEGAARWPRSAPGRSS